MRKSILSAILSSLVILALLGGLNLASAHKDENRGREREEIKVKLIKNRLSEFSLRGDGRVQIKKAEITRLGQSEFDVVVGGITFTVQVASTTRFLGKLTFADAAIGKIIDTKGTVDPANVRALRAETVKIRQPGIVRR